MPFTQGLPANRAAFLDMLAFAEIGPALLAKSDDGYDVIVGSTAKNPVLFSSYADHPRIFVWQLDSTAAGRYQIIKGMYDVLRARLSLPDISPSSQDAMALEMLREKKALAAIDAGHLQKAILLASSVWASLPGSKSGQRTQPLSALVQAYQAAGGALLPYAA